MRGTWNFFELYNHFVFPAVSDYKFCSNKILTKDVLQSVYTIILPGKQKVYGVSIEKKKVCGYSTRGTINKEEMKYPQKGETSTVTESDSTDDL